MSNVSVTIKQLSSHDDYRYQSSRDPYRMAGLGGSTYEMSVMFNAPVFYVRHQVDHFFHEDLKHRGDANEYLVKHMTDQLLGHLRGEIEAEIKRQVLANRPIRPEDYAHIIKKG